MQPEIVAAGWRVPDDVVGLVTTCRIGNLALHTGDDPGRVAANRRELASSLAGGEIQWLEQVHGCAAFHADASTVRLAPRADAAWTASRGIAIAVLTADCVPVLFSDRGGRVVGAAHAGWRGLRQGVLGVLVEQMPAAPADLISWIGPAIGVHDYEVGEDVWGQFADEYADCLLPHAQDRAKRMLDLSGVVYAQLVRLGVGVVTRSRLDTYHDPRFYSHRRQHVLGGDAAGRFASVVMRRPLRSSRS